MTPKPHFSILATSFAGGPRPRTVALVLLGLWTALFFAALFAPAVLDDADGTHAQAARAMVATGDLVTLHVDGVRYLEKAPLPYWLVAACYRVFGFNTFATHLPQALAVALLALLGHRWANQAFGARTGYYTAVAVLTAAGVFLFTRIFIPEVLLSLELGAAFFAFLRLLSPPVAVPAMHALPAGSARVPERPAVAWYAGPLFYAAAMWGSLALAVLTKGLVALVFFFATTGLFLLLTGELHRWRELRPFSGGLLFLAVAAPWHVLAGLRNTGGADGHGFFWFYFVNEHVLRFLGRRIPHDYNRVPGWLYWAQHLAWLYPWSLFLPLAGRALWQRWRHQISVLTAAAGRPHPGLGLAFFLPLAIAVAYLAGWGIGGFTSLYLLLVGAWVCAVVAVRRRRSALEVSPFHRIDAQQRSILLLSLWAAVVLVFFSLSTSQEYYTFPAYLPLLLLTAATITRGEQTYSSDPAARRLLGFTHAAFAVLGGIFAIALAWGLWDSRHLPFEPDIGELMAHRGVGSYTLSMSHLFDLTAGSFAALRLPAALAMLVFAAGPALAWLLRAQRRHIAATTAIAITAAGFLFAAHLALVRFEPLLSSRSAAVTLERLARAGRLEPGTRVLLYGDQAFGSSIPFYLGRPVELVEGRSTSMLFGSTFADAPPIFLTDRDLLAQWGHGPRIVLFVPLEQRDQVDSLLGPRQHLLEEFSGKVLVTDRPLP